MPDLKDILRIRLRIFELNCLSPEELIAFREGAKNSALEAGRAYCKSLSCLVRDRDIFRWRKRLPAG